MSFALTHCSEDLIETVLKSKLELQLQVLQERVKFLVGDKTVSKYEENKVADVRSLNALNSSPLWETGGKTIQVLQNTTQTAKDVLTTVGSTRFWKDAVKWIPNPALNWNSKDLNDENDNNADFFKQGACAFYSGLIENCHISSLEANYQRYARPDPTQPLEISYSILRATKIQDGLKHEASFSSVENNVLLDVAKFYLPQDTAYSFYVLMALLKPEKADALFSSLPSSPVILQLACFYYATNIYMSLGLLPFTVEKGFEINPSDFIREVLDFEKSDEISKEFCVKLKDETVQMYFNLLRKYDKMLYDFVQAQILHSIGGGVDATRFANDDIYKRDTILGISMTLDDSVFQIAVSLASHYNIPVWDIYMTHLEYLFLEPSVTAAVITARIESFKFAEKLLLQKKSFEEHLQNIVYPGLSGMDHEKLLICFNLLEKCGDTEDCMSVKPSLHKKMLAKFKAAMNNIDYKIVMSPESSLSYFSTILNESNVHIFAKAACDIPKQDGGFYQSTFIYCLWAQKFFFDGNSSNAKVPTTKTDWLHRYENCADMLQKLEPSDVLNFIDGVIFSNKGLETLSSDCRSEIVKRAMKFCRAKSAKHKNNILTSTEWSDAASTLNSYHSHLQRLEDETFVQLMESQDSKIKSYCKDFDLSKSSAEKLQDLLVRIVLEGPDLELLKTFMSCCPPSIDWEPSDAYLKAINFILQQLKLPEKSRLNFFKDNSPINVLESILEDLSQEKDELLIEDMAADILNEFCQQSDVSVATRLSILQLLEKSNCLSDEYSDLLLLYRTQAVVSAIWPDIQVSEEEVADEFQRRTLFESLLSLSLTVESFQSLSKLLVHWPPFSRSSSGSCNDEAWVKLLDSLLDLSTKDALTSAIGIFERALTYPTFDAECCEEVFNKLKGKGSILHTLKCALKTDFSSLHSEAIRILKDEKQVKEDDYDNEILELLLQHKLTAQIVSTDLYKPVIEFLLHCQDDSVQENYKSIDSVVGELHDAGYESEAGSLLLIKNSTHSSLSTFSSAFYELRKWVSNLK